MQVFSGVARRCFPAEARSLHHRSGGALSRARAQRDVARSPLTPAGPRSRHASHTGDLEVPSKGFDRMTSQSRSSTTDDDGAGTVEVAHDAPHLAVVTLQGEHDISTSDRWTGLEQAAAHSNVLVDLSACTFADSTVITVLIRTAETVKAGGEQLVLVDPARAARDCARRRDDRARAAHPALRLARRRARGLPSPASDGSPAGISPVRGTPPAGTCR